MQLKSLLKSITYPLKLRKGFTLIEMIVVMTIFAVMVAGTLPILSLYKNKQTISGLATDLLQVLRRAQGRALSGTNGLNWGVYISQDTSVGSTFDTFDMFAGIAPDQYPQYKESHQVKRPFHICTNKSDKRIIFPTSITIANNEKYYIELYSEDSDENIFVLVNTTGTVEVAKTNSEWCHP